MKAKKAIKRLGRVEALLETVIDQYDGCPREVHNLLDTARSSVASAHQALAAAPAKKPPAKAVARRKGALAKPSRKVA